MKEIDWKVMLGRRNCTMLHAYLRLSDCRSCSVLRQYHWSVQWLHPRGQNIRQWRNSRYRKGSSELFVPPSFHSGTGNVWTSKSIIGLPIYFDSYKQSNEQREKDSCNKAPYYFFYHFWGGTTFLMIHRIEKATFLFYFLPTTLYRMIATASLTIPSPKITEKIFGC